MEKLGLNQRLISAIVIFCIPFFFAGSEFPFTRIFPSLVALSIVFLLRSALIGLLAGAACGSILLAKGNIISAYISFFNDHLIPALQNRWNISVLVFTLLMGGFVSLIEFGGGVQNIIDRCLRSSGTLKQKVQWSAFVFGLVCFFDGLANSMLVGRVMRPIADQAGISREKLSYIVDSTSSPIACIALISTWIAYQLSMIEEGLKDFNIDQSSYLLFFQSIPYNFYCIFTLFTVVCVIFFDFNIGPMAKAEDVAKPKNHLDIISKNQPAERHWMVAVGPLFFLITTLMIGLYVDGAENLLPISVTSITSAYGNADAALVLVCSSAFAGIIAFVLNIKGSIGATGNAYFRGVTDLLKPVLILISAWCLSSTLKQLGTTEVLVSHLSETVSPNMIPFMVFIVGALISFFTGTSWGTMGVLMPLALPIAISLSSTMDNDSSQMIIVGSISAVFSGAVFGDHCSPMSDTTIVSSIACDIEPISHIKTQLPYAIIAAIAAGLFGFLPCGFGISYLISLPFGMIALLVILYLFKKPLVSSQQLT